MSDEKSGKDLDRLGDDALERMAKREVMPRGREKADKDVMQTGLEMKEQMLKAQMEDIKEDFMESVDHGKKRGLVGKYIGKRARNAHLRHMDSSLDKSNELAKDQRKTTLERMEYEIEMRSKGSVLAQKDAELRFWMSEEGQESSIAPLQTEFYEKIKAKLQSEEALEFLQTDEGKEALRLIADREVEAKLIKLDAEIGKESLEIKEKQLDLDERRKDGDHRRKMEELQITVRNSLAMVQEIADMPQYKEVLKLYKNLTEEGGKEEPQEPF